MAYCSQLRWLRSGTWYALGRGCIRGGGHGCLIIQCVRQDKRQHITVYSLPTPMEYPNWRINRATLLTSGRLLYIINKMNPTARVLTFNTPLVRDLSCGLHSVPLRHQMHTRISHVGTLVHWLGCVGSWALSLL